MIKPHVAAATTLLAALAVAFSVSPAHGWMQTVANRLFATADPLNTGVLLERAGQVFREVSTEANLMANFSDLVCDAFGTTKALLLRADDEGGFRQVYPEAAGKPFQLWPGAALTTLLRRDREALTVDTLQRMRSSPAVEEALKTLKGAGMALAAGSFMRGEMKAVLLLASKKTGRIYDLRDQRTLQLLCDQFAVALENANLYTAVQNGKIYNDILLDSLTSGIVAVDADRRVTGPDGKLAVPPDDPRYTLRRVWLTKEEEDAYYYGYSNEALWPLCHMVFNRPAFKKEDWDYYQQVKAVPGDQAYTPLAESKCSFVKKS